MLNISPTARGVYRMQRSIFSRPQSPHAGGDARAPRMHVVRSFCRSL